MYTEGENLVKATEYVKDIVWINIIAEFAPEVEGNYENPDM